MKIWKVVDMGGGGSGMKIYRRRWIWGGGDSGMKVWEAASMKIWEGGGIWEGST